MNTHALQALNKLSTRLGQQPLLVQGAGGNISFKEKDILWVKASGKWLAHAESENIFVAVNLNNIYQDIVNDVLDPVNKHIIDSNSLRPSIETTLHALLPHKVVLHVHSINALCWAVNKNGEHLLKELLQGLKWVWVDYHRPGLALTHAVKAKLKEKPDILILANHGLVIGADDCVAAEKLLNEVEERLQRMPRESIDPDYEYLNKIQQATGWQLPVEAVMHSLATDPLSFQLAIAGAMYPDHVVFLKAKAPYLMAENLSTITTVILTDNANYVLIKDKGVLVSQDISNTAQQMLLCQTLLLLRLCQDESINYLSKNDIHQLLNWEAEKYRQKLIK